MFRRLKKYLFPAAVIFMAAISALAGGRRPYAILTRTEPRPDTVIYDNSSIYTKFRDEKILEEVSEELDSVAEEKVISARDTMKVPDSLKYTDPFRYKYYVALNDSLTHVQVKDSLIEAGDSVVWRRIDSIYFADSAAAAKRQFEIWYNSLDKSERKKYDFNQKMIRKQHLADSIYAARDSIKAIRDSIRESIPRVLETFTVPDSMQYKRIFSFTVDRDFNTVKTSDIDTSYNYWFNDVKFMREDVNAVFLGTSGSPMQYYDFSKRKSEEGVTFYDPYESYSFSPGTVKMYNSKTPYTELAYWGTLFANKEQEEDNIHIMTTQNIYPELNVTLSYDRTGSNGMLDNESVANKTAFAGVNWLGKKYSASFGYIFNSIRKAENGGVDSVAHIRDTTMGVRDIAVKLSDADNLIKKNTLFLNQTYRIPFSFLKKKSAEDSIAAAGGMIDKDVTTAFIGHNSEYSVYRKIYTDNISANDLVGRDYYHGNFFINPTESNDSLRVMKFENKVFIKLQPWAEDAIVSSVNAGIGNRIMNYYMFSPLGYLTSQSNHSENSSYLYGGVAGQLQKYIDWNARGSYTFAGPRRNDFSLEADASLSLYPFRKFRKSPLTFSAHFETSLEAPDYFQQHYYSNHLQWESSFDKISRTSIEGRLSIPHRKFSLEAGYTLLSNNIYYDSLAVARQNTDAMSVAKLAINKDFTLWKLHFDNKALFQYSSAKDIVPLPAAALNLKWYLQFDVVKNVLQMQIGANTLYTSKWYAPGYNPELGNFHNQKREKYGDSPYIDVFVNMQWKRATIFVKLINANMGWPKDSADYFSADGYIRSQRALKFGIWWPFYTQTRKNSTVSAGGGSSAGSDSGPTRPANRSAGGSSSYRTATR